MPSRKTYDYDSFEDDDDDLDDFKNLKIKAGVGHQKYKIDENNCTRLVLQDATCSLCQLEAN